MAKGFKTGGKVKRKLDFVVDANGCFNCTSHKAERVYGGHRSSIVKFEGRNWLLHRLVYTWMFGDIPAGQVVRHKCHNGACINPEHLLLGTQKDNARDMIESGRNTCGARIITDEQAEQIRDLLKSGRFMQKEIAAMYGLSPAAVCDIKRERTWKPVDLERRKQNKGVSV